MSADRNLLFAVLALQADCVNREQFIDACTAWAANKNTPIDALMVQRGWLTSEDRADVEGVRGQIELLFPHLKDGTVVLVSAQLPVGSVAAVATPQPSWRSSWIRPKGPSRRTRHS